MRHLCCAVVLALMVASCGGGGEASPSTTTGEATTTVTQPSTTTTTRPTTTTTEATTTTTEPPTPEESRAEFLEGLVADGWVTYEHSIVGYKIMYPPTWAVLDDSEPETFVLFGLEGDAGGVLFVTAGLDSGHEATGSEDYIHWFYEEGVAEGNFLDGEQRWNSLDYDFDGSESVLDLYGVDTSWAMDLSTGEPLPEDQLVPTTIVAYYDPDAQPDYGFTFSTLGVGHEFWRDFQRVVLSFQPPET